MENLKKFGENLVGNASFVVMALLVVAVVFVISFVAEKMYGYKRDVSPVRKLTVMALFSALSIIINLFSFPVPVIAPGFYKMDFSEIPVLICGFMFGPVAGAMVEFVKILLNLLINGTATMFVGEFANFVVGCSLVVPASIVYMAARTKKGALVGMIIGTLIMTVAGCMLNAWLLLPWYAKNFFAAKGGMDAIIGAGTAVYGVVDSIFTFVVLIVAPFNLVKGVVVSVVTFIVYKKAGKVLKIH